MGVGVILLGGAGRGKGPLPGEGQAGPLAPAASGGLGWATGGFLVSPWGDGEHRSFSISAGHLKSLGVGVGVRRGIPGSVLWSLASVVLSVGRVPGLSTPVDPSTSPPLSPGFEPSHRGLSCLA